MKIMGLDYGSVTVGVAISDAMLLTAQPVEVIKRKSENKTKEKKNNRTRPHWAN